MNYRLKGLTAILFILFYSANAISQSKLTGIVKDEQAKPVPLANVVLKDTKDTTQILYGTVTDFEGKYSIDSITGSRFRFVVSYIGYQPFVALVEITPPETVKDVMLKPTVTNLSEVAVKGSSITSDINKTSYLITADDRKKAASTLDLMQKIPFIRTDNLNYKILTQNNVPVKLLLNGLSATVQELMTIQPEDIVKIEYYDIPPARFTGSIYTAAVNVITKKKTQGGYVTIDLSNALTTGFGNELLSMKYHQKRTQFGIYYYLGYRDYSARVVDRQLSYKLNGNNYSVINTGLNSPFAYQQNILDMNIIHEVKDNYQVRIKLSTEATPVNYKTDYNITYLLNDSLSSGTGKSSFKKSYFNPVVDIYFAKTLKKSQTFLLNLVGNYFKTNTKYDQFEIVASNDTILSDNLTSRNIKKSVIGEAVYIKKSKKGNASLGIRYSKGWFSQKLDNSLDNGKYSIENSEQYLYGEISGKIKNLSGLVIAGLNASQFSEHETGSYYSFLMFRPLLRISYKLSENSQLKATYTANPKNPTFSQLSLNKYYEAQNVVYSGNSQLKPYISHDFSLSFNYNKPGFFISPMIQYSFSKNRIMSEYTDEGSYILHSLQNQGRHHDWAISTSMNYTPFKSKWMRLSLYGQLYQFQNKYDSEQLFTLRDFYLYMTIDLYYKNFLLRLMYQKDYKTLSDQIVNYHGIDSKITLQYKYKSLTFMAGIWNPLSDSWKADDYTLPGTLINDRSQYRIFDNGRMFFLQFRYNLNIGKEFNADNKQLQNKDADFGAFSPEKY